MLMPSDKRVCGEVASGERRKPIDIMISLIGLHLHYFEDFLDTRGNS